MENATEYGTLAKEVALHLGVNPNTLRRWSLELEKQHYLFERNAKGQRIYYEREKDENIALSMRDLAAMIDSAVQKAVEQEREAMFQALELKMNEAIEQHDRMLMQSINQKIEEKRLEIAAATEKENEKNQFSTGSKRRDSNTKNKCSFLTLKAFESEKSIRKT